MADFQTLDSRYLFRVQPVWLKFCVALVCFIFATKFGTSYSYFGYTAIIHQSPCCYVVTTSNWYSRLVDVDVITLHNACAVHWWVFSTLGDIMSTPEVFITVGDTMSTMRGDTMMSVRDIMSTAVVFSTLGGFDEYTGGYHDECGGYHQYTAECSVHWGFHTNSIVSSMTFPYIYHDIPRCTHDILPVY